MTTEKKIEKYKAERAIGQLTMLKMLKTKFEYQDSAERFVENLEYAISCIEKQIPKKPDRTSRPYKCPVCGSWEGVRSSGWYLPPYCCMCGTKLDWSYSDEKI